MRSFPYRHGRRSRRQRDAAAVWSLAGLGLAIVFVVAAVGAAWAQAAPLSVTVALIDDKFEPDHLHLAAGVRYRLHLENRGRHLHEFTAPQFFAAATIENPEILNREHSEVVLQPGEGKDVVLTIPRPGSFELRCADHDWEGMVGHITVE